MGEQNKPIAIKFGSSGPSSKPNKPNKPATSLGKRPRAGAFGHDSDDDDDQIGKKEEITGFSADGTEINETRRREEAKQVKKEYVIERIANKDWRGEARAKQNTAVTVDEQPKEIKWGLTVKDKSAKENTTESKQPEQKSSTDRDDAPPKSVDDQAMDALLGKTEDKKLVIPALTEDEAYQRDANAAGADSTLDDYEAMPVEEFGAALLRGMGWDGKSNTKNEVKKRKLFPGSGDVDAELDIDMGKKKGKVRVGDYRREEEKRRSEKESRKEGSYKSERDRERREERYGDRHRSEKYRDDRDRNRDYGRDRDRDRDRRRHDDRRR